MADREGWSEAEDNTFAARIAAHLRAPVHTEGSFEERLMHAVREQAPELYPRPASRVDSRTPTSSWWGRPRAMRISPLAGLASAAAFAGLVALGTLALTRRTAEGPVPALASVPSAVPDTVQVVRFIFVEHDAESVSLVGDFNAWTKGATPLRPTGAPGVWAATVSLEPGRHEYAFIVNGKRWRADPLAMKTRDDFGTESSVIHVARGNPGAT